MMPYGPRLACAAAVLAAYLSVSPGSAAAAAGPPTVDDAALAGAMAVNSRQGPPDATEQRSVCAAPAWSGGSPQEASTAQRVLDLPAAWQFSRGAGQKVAVIDTGVNRHPRLPTLQPGGDFVAGSDGTADCDGHGTLVAGIIAAQPSPDDAFVGVAPEATILTIRQLSLAYEAKDRARRAGPGAMAATGYGNVLTSAAAVVRAVELGASVIDISEVACAEAGTDVADAALGAAVKFAYDRNVVVVVAAGNLTPDTACRTQNSAAGWSQVQTIASPAWFVPYVLSVASVDPDGRPSDLSLHGPWVGVAAVGRGIVSLDSKPGGTGLVNSAQTFDGLRQIDGTSFAASYVAGLAALVRARFPMLSAAQVMDRITRTAHAPGATRDDRIGYGMIDPLAALTAQLPDRPVGAGADIVRRVAPPAAQAAVSERSRRIAVVGSIVLLVALGLGVALTIAFRRDRVPAEDTDR